MKVVETIRKKLAEMGFIPNQQQNISSGQIISVVLSSIQCILLGIGIFYSANTIEEYMNLIFSLTVTFAIEITFISIIVKNDKLFDSIEFFEKELNESEYNVKIILHFFVFQIT